jgi:regulator of sigma E protease
MMLLGLLVMVFGFGFVVFWHELGHFLAAKWAGVRVEQFAVGFGNAIACWRKGIGLTVGTSAKEYERRAREKLTSDGHTGEPSLQQLDAAAKSIGLSETEYRINWIPLGGYVKMLGQEDTDPTATSADPRSYTEKSVGKRMVIISAGVIMNVILAGILFVVLFLFVGFRVPPATIGSLQAGSPAQAAGLKVGDQIIEIDGHPISDFTKISFNVALLPDSPVPVKFIRDGKEQTTNVHARRSEDNGGMMALGFAPPPMLQGANPEKVIPEQFTKLPAESQLLKPGEVILAINGEPLSNPSDIALLDKHVQTSGGKPLTMQIKGVDGQTRDISVPLSFGMTFNRAPLNFAGLTPRTTIESIADDSAVEGKLRPGDVVISIRNQATGNLQGNVGLQDFISTVRAAGQSGQKLNLVVLRDGKPIEINDLEASTRTARGQKGFGVGVSSEIDRAIVGTVMEKTPAADAGIPLGATLTKIGDRAVSSWFDVKEALRAQAQAGQPLAVEATLSDGSTKTLTMTPRDEDVKTIAGYTYSAGSLVFDESSFVRKTSSPATAIVWGVGETRDLIVKSYVTLKRMFVDRTVSPSNLMGPIEIFRSGSLFAQKGPDWFIWFLAMISANLAVVNFLPIPIVDGGHFAFLLIEKLTGKKPSPAVQAVSAYIGLGLLLSLFLFVTYNDLGRIFMIW